MSKLRSYIPIIIAAAVSLPGIYVKISGTHLSPMLMAIVAGCAIMAASFLLLWACDAAQGDISQTLALAVVAFIAVLPEYAVDMYFTWQAGKHPASNYAHYAIANMTGANRLIIGVAWVTIAVIFWLKFRKEVRLESERRTEIIFLGMATIYAFVIPIKGTLTLIDGFVFLAIYVWYITIASKRPCEESEADGPAKVIFNLPKNKRRLATLAMFLFAAGAILANAEQFSEGLIGTGKALKINEFLLVQWIAPIASEMPEFVVSIMFALRGKAGLALGSLLSSKLNQWTLLVGMIPGVFAAASGTIQHPIPLMHFQMNEILLTAAQSLLAVIIISNLRLTIGQAVLLFLLFIGQLISPEIIPMLPGKKLLGINGNETHALFAVFYCVASATLYFDYPGGLRGLLGGLRSGKK